MEAPLSRLLSLVLLTQSVLIIKVNKDTESQNVEANKLSAKLA